MGDGGPAGPAAVPFRVRRVVTGPGGSGSGRVVEDGDAPEAVGLAGGPGVATLLWLDRWPRSPGVGQGASPGPLALEPPPGGLCWRVVRLPPPPPGSEVDETWLRMSGDDPARPGSHATDTLDLMVVLDGELVLGLDDGERHLARGDAVVQRGTVHRWRVVGDEPCTYAVAMLRPDPAAASGGGGGLTAGVPVGAGDETVTGGGVRRIVTGAGPGGRSGAVADGPPPVLARAAGGHGPTVAELWWTGGPPSTNAQGGDRPIDRADHEQPIEGAVFRMLEWSSVRPGQSGGAPAAPDGRTEAWPAAGTPGLATSALDLAVVVAGQVELDLGPGVTLTLGPGDVAVQRGVAHRWIPVGGPGGNVRVATLTIGTDGH